MISYSFSKRYNIFSNYMNLTKKIAFLFTLLFFIKVLNAQTPIKDFDLTINDFGSDPEDFIALGDFFIFTATDGYNGRTLWKCDGTEEGTQIILKDDPEDLRSYLRSGIKNHVFHEEEIYFVGYNYINNPILIKSDGSQEGTVKILDLPMSDHYIISLTGNRIFISSYQYSDQTISLYLYDLISQELNLVKNAIPSQDKHIHLGSINGVLLFNTLTRDNLNTVWRSDGTEDGTFKLVENLSTKIRPESDFALAPYLNYNGNFYFSDQEKIWKTDGNPENTQILAEFDALLNEAEISFQDAIEINGKLYYLFSLRDGYKTIIYEVNPDTPDNNNLIFDQAKFFLYNVSNLVKKENLLIFTGPGITGGTDLISYDTDTKTFEYHFNLDHEVDEFLSFYEKNDPRRQFRLQLLENGSIFCGNPLREEDDWIIDIEMEEYSNLGTSIKYGTLFYFNQRIFIDATISAQGKELVSLDMAGFKVQLVKNINEVLRPYTNPQLTMVKDKLVFTSIINEVAFNLWGYNQKEVLPLLENMQKFESTTLMDNNLIFTTQDGQLWNTDGTIDNTFQVNKDNENGSFKSIFEYQGETHYTLNNYSADKNSVVKIENGEIVYVIDFVNGSSDYGYGLLPVSEKIFINSGISLEENQLDVLSPATGKALHLNTIVFPHYLEEANGLVYTTGRKLFNENELDPKLYLFRTDGTIEGTNILAGEKYDDAVFVKSFHDKILFIANSQEYGYEFWITDGSEEGTQILKDINEGEESAFERSIYINSIPTFEYKDHLYFVANDGIHGEELWKTDGTLEGTKLAFDILDGPLGSSPNNFSIYEDTVFFSAFTLDEGRELWTIVNEEANLRSDIIPGAESSFPFEITPSKDNIYFVAKTVDRGYQILELYSSKFVSEPEDPEFDGALNIYPNPGKELLFLTTEDTIQEIKAFNVSGMIIKKWKGDTKEINVSDLPRGIYFFRIETDKTTVVKSFVKV